jgi:hypothetical protein
LSAEFPAGWRYVPLRLTADRAKWINAIPYRQLSKEHKLGEFYGVDVDGNSHFEKQIVPPDGMKLLSDGIAGVAEKAGHGVGIFMRYSYPQLVIVDCDTQVDTVVEGGSASFKLRKGRDQLLALFERRGEEIPPCPVVRGNREGHGYLIFRQNRNCPIRTRKIRPYGLAFDVLGAGHQNHWTCGNRELVAGRELLDAVPELPEWFARLIVRDKPATSPAERGAINPDNKDPWTQMFMDAVLRQVTNTSPGWNQNLFNAACTLAENGLAWERLTTLIIDRCEPENETEYMVAMNSIASAWRKVTGEAVPE